MSTPAGRAADPSDHRNAWNPVAVVAPAAFFVAVQFYSSLEALSPTPPAGFTLVNRAGAALLAGALALAGLGCAAALFRDAGPPRAGTSRTILGAWIGAAALSAVLGLAPLEGLQIVAMMLLAGCCHLALVRFYERPAVARAVIFSYLVAGALAAAAGIVMVLAKRPVALYAATHGRAAGVFVSANEFAEFLDLFIFVALGAGLAASERGLRTLAFGAALLGALALTLTFSRENWAGVVAAAAFLAFALGRRRLAAGVLAAAAVTAAALALRPFPHHDPSDSFGRLRTLEGGLRVATLFPLTGAGPVEYWRAYPAIRPVNGPPPGTFGALHPHNVYVSLAGETGIVGLAAGAFGWFWFARALRRRLAVAPVANRRLALAICGGFVAILVAGLFDTIGIVQLTFVWIPYTGLALAAAEAGPAWEAPAP